MEYVVEIVKYLYTQVEPGHLIIASVLILLVVGVAVKFALPLLVKIGILGPKEEKESLNDVIGKLLVMGTLIQDIKDTLSETLKVDTQDLELAQSRFGEQLHRNEVMLIALEANVGNVKQGLEAKLNEILDIVKRNEVVATTFANQHQKTLDAIAKMINTVERIEDIVKDGFPELRNYYMHDVSKEIQQINKDVALVSALIQSMSARGITLRP